MNLKPPRQPVLLLSHDDGYIEVFGDPTVVDVKIIRLPGGCSREYEPTADDVLGMLMPHRYRRVWRDDYLRANGSTRPLHAAVMQNALGMADAVHTLNEFAKEGDA